MSTPLDLTGDFKKVHIFHPTNEEYPAPKGEYTVKTKNGNHWREHKNARLQISVGQPNHEGAKLEATVEWVKNRFTPKKKSVVHVGINDSLQRWNYIFNGLSHTEAMAKSIELGDAWMERNSHIIARLPNAQFTRWEAWRNDDNFEDAKTKAAALYGINKEFRDAIDQNIQDFWDRQKAKKNLADQDFDRFKHFSKEYLIEETAVFSLMFKQKPAVDIYPGDTLLPCVIFQGRTDIDELPEGLGTGSFTRIDHVKNNGFRADLGNGSTPHNPVNQNSGPSGGNNPLKALGRIIHENLGNIHFANGDVSFKPC